MLYGGEVAYRRVRLRIQVMPGLTEQLLCGLDYREQLREATVRRALKREIGVNIGWAGRERPVVQRLQSARLKRPLVPFAEPGGHPSHADTPPSYLRRACGFLRTGVSVKTPRRRRS